MAAEGNLSFYAAQEEEIMIFGDGGGRNNDIWRWRREASIEPNLLSAEFKFRPDVGAALRSLDTHSLRSVLVSVLRSAGVFCAEIISIFPDSGRFADAEKQVEKTLHPYFVLGFEFDGAGGNPVSPPLRSPGRIVPVMTVIPAFQINLQMLQPEGAVRVFHGRRLKEALMTHFRGIILAELQTALLMKLRIPFFSFMLLLNSMHTKHLLGPKVDQSKTNSKFSPKITFVSKNFT
ncbi:uncharacterized protein LOC106947150 [Poecilia latipinna]|uniref:uncharacterized protein LOC106947150 n=1 Tax=Poecilia latipinna TaxID=48699 RepID=UPI00072E4151|nr:PREDICTED: uncharacterized protein LOC106947150 [Poecilia latipinna]